MKKYTKIVLAGGTGQIGQALCKHYKDQADEIIILSRSAEKQIDNLHYLNWDGKTLGDWATAIDGADMLINLAGKNVNCRYNEKNKKEIFDSRTNSIEVLAKAVAHCKQAPKIWLQCASATIYRHAEDRPISEEDSEIGTGFSVEVCKKWEKTFWEQTENFKEMRKIVLRTSLVLGPTEGVFPRLKNLVCLGLGGQQGNGKQWVSWIHEKDVCGIIDWTYDHPEIKGTLNCTAPVPLQNKAFMDVIRKAFKMPVGLPAPKWLLEIGAFIIGTETELILKSRWVLPTRLINAGYRFKYAEADAAIKEILNS